MVERRRATSHDAFVRYVFGRRRAAAVLVRRALHPEVRRHVDFGSLRAVPTVHTDDRLATRLPDLCFLADVLHQARRYPLLAVIEHRSSPAPRMPLRAHAYVGDLWRWYIKDHPGPPHAIPFVLPILLVQPPARHTPHRLTDTLAVPPALRATLGAPVELALAVDDLSGSVLDDEADPPTRALVELARAFLGAYGNPGALTPTRVATLAEQLDVLLEHEGPHPDDGIHGGDDLRALWSYVIEVFEEGSPVRAMIEDAISQPAREAYMTIKDAILAEGMQKGMQEGMQKGMARGRATAVLDLLELRGLPVSGAVRRRVLATRSEPTLRRWLARALVVPSAERLFDRSPGRG